MIQKIQEPISVAFISDFKRHKIYPKAVFWANKVQPITQVGFHHTYKLGQTLYHVFSVASKTTFFRLKLNTENLLWTLEEVSDGLPS